MLQWWFSDGEGADLYGRGDQLYDEGIRLTHCGGYAEAEAAIVSAVATYREIWERTGALEAKRRLAKALWRRAILLHEVGSPSEALEVGFDGINLGREVLDATAADDAAFDLIVREVAIAMNDLAQVAGQAGRVEMYRDLLEQAVRVSTRCHGAAARQALGTSLHNLAQLGNEQMRLAGSRDPASATRHLQFALGMANGALGVREALVEASDEPLFRWELANSLCLFGELQCFASDATGLQTLTRAQEVLVGLPSPPFYELRVKISERLVVMEQLVAHMAQRNASVTPTTDRLCACGSGRPFARCHGSDAEP